MPYAFKWEACFSLHSLLSPNSVQALSYRRPGKLKDTKPVLSAGQRAEFACLIVQGQHSRPLTTWPPKLVVKDKCYSNSWSWVSTQNFKSWMWESCCQKPQGPRPYCCCNNSQWITATKTKYVILRLQLQPRPLLQVALQLLTGGKAPVICSVLWYQQWLHAHIQW